MKQKMVYQSIADLKELRKILGLTKDVVADNIGYSVRTLERIEEENVVLTESIAKKLCQLYQLNFEEHFYKADKKFNDKVKELEMRLGKRPENLIYKENEYYYLYVRKVDLFGECIIGRVTWIANYNRNKERRKLEKVNPERVLYKEPHINIINTGDEWEYWRFSLTIGKIYKVLVSEKCMKECLSRCLKEYIVRRDELMIADGISDLIFLT